MDMTLDEPSVKLRRVEILRDGVWREAAPEEIHSGDTFRMFDSDDGSAVEAPGGGVEFTATSEPQPMALGNWGIEVVGA